MLLPCGIKDKAKLVTVDRVVLGGRIKPSFVEGKKEFRTGTKRFLEMEDGDVDTGKGEFGAGEDRPKRRQ